MPLQSPLHRLLAVAVALAATAGCSGAAASPSVLAALTPRVPTPAPATSTPAAPTATPTAAPTPAPAPPPPSGPAPLIVQVDNYVAARPQSGLGQADVVYEYETEGGVSRYSLVFFAPPAGAVGPVRSARLATVHLLDLLGGALLYSGASRYVQQVLDAGPHAHFDEDNGGGALYRVRSRVAPQNLYTDGQHIQALEARASLPAVPYRLWERTDPGALPAGGTAVTRARVPVSSGEVPIFTYDTGRRAWARTEPATGPVVDAATGTPWAPATVVVLQVPVALGPEVEDVSGVHGLDHTLVGSGRGQLLAGGQLYDIGWAQAPSGLPALTLDGGAPAPIPPGQVLVVLVRQGTTVITG